MAKKSKKSVVWLSRDVSGYEIYSTKPTWVNSLWRRGGRGRRLRTFCTALFGKYLKFFKMPPNSLGKITNTANTLTFEIIETK